MTTSKSYKLWWFFQTSPQLKLVVAILSLGCSAAVFRLVTCDI